MTAPRLAISARGRRFLNAYSQVQRFRRVVPQIEADAAKTATQVSRAVFTRQLGHRPVAQPRQGRPTTGGAFAQFIEWTPANNGTIGFDLQLLRGAAPYFLIQEIGTGKSATILNPAGTVAVRSQVGRQISANLYWATGAGANAVGARTGANRDQLYLAAELNAATLAAVPRRRKRIRREIHGKHYLQAGGRAGFLELRTRLADEANRIFR